MKWLLVFGASFFLFMPNIFSQEDTLAKPLQEIVVTAFRSGQKESSIAYVANIVSRKEINQFQPRTTPEALMGTAGVFLQKTNHGGGSAFIRGLTGNQTLIMLDGIRLNNATFRFGPNQYLNTIDIFSIQQIEIVKGTGAVQYGTDALGGVIQVITKDAVFSKKQKWDASLQAKLMSAGMEQTGRADFAYSSNQFAATAGITTRNFGNILGGDTTGFQNPSGYKEIAYDVKLKFLLGKNIELTTAHHLLRQQNVAVYHKVALENFMLNEMSPQQRMLTYTKLKIENENQIAKKIEFTLSHQQTSETRNSQKNGTTVLRKELDQVNTIGLTADVQSVYNKYWTSNSGMDLYTDKIKSIRNDINTNTQLKSAKRGLYPDGATYGNYSIFSLHQISFKKWQVSAGVRYNSFSIKINDTSLGKVQLTPTAFVFNAGIIYTVSKKHLFFASFNNNFRAPNVDDMGTLGIVDFRYELPAYNLNPEQSYNYEVGYKLRTNKMNITTAAYHMQIRQLITRVKVDGQQINGYNVYLKENTDQAFIRGIEAEMDMEIIRRLRVQSGIAYTYGQNKTRNEPLRRIPPFNGRVRATYTKNKWVTTAECLFAAKQTHLAQGDKEDNRIPLNGTPGFAILNAFAGYEWKTIRVQTGLQNIFNKDYRTHGSGINGYGRSVWVHIQFMFN